MIGTLFSLISIGALYLGNQPARDDKRRGEEAYRKLRERQDDFHRNYAKQSQCYLDEFCRYNRNFWPDGSLKYDSLTARYYEQGQYFCRSDGLMADYSIATPAMKHPPG